MTAAPFDNCHDLTLAGGPVRLYSLGDPAAEPVLLLHGAMLDTAPLTWLHLAPLLATSYRVYAIDLPRHGGSRPWTGRVGQGVLERVVDETIGHLGARRMPLVGLSLGGSVALGYALRHPDRVPGAVVLAPGGLEARRPAQFLIWAFQRTPGAQRATTGYLARSPKAVRRSLESTLSRGAHTPGFDRLVTLAHEEAVRKHAGREPALDDWQTLAHGPFAMRTHVVPDLDQMKVPTLWLRGDQDPLVSRENVEAAVAATPDAVFAPVVDAGHLSTLDQPEQVHGLVDGFLRGVGRGR